MGSSVSVGIVYGFKVDTDGGTCSELEEYLEDNFPKTLEVSYTGDMYHWSIPIIHIKDVGMNSWSCYEEVSSDYLRDMTEKEFETQTLRDVHTNLVDLFSYEYGPQVGDIGWILYGNYG